MRQPSQSRISGPLAPAYEFAGRLWRASQRTMVSTEDPELARLLARVVSRRRDRLHVLAGDRTVAARAATASPRQTAQLANAPAGRVLACEDVAPDVRILRVARPAALRFHAGQSAKLGIGGEKPNSYSIASAPNDPFLEFCIEKHATGRLSPKFFDLHPGDSLELSRSAKGSLLLDDKAHVHLMVATVTGIAPFMSMLRQFRDTALPGQFIVLHGASYQYELPYRAELAAWDERDPQLVYVPTVSRPNEAANRGFTGETRRVDTLAERFIAELDPARTRVYACGNGGMVKNVRERFVAAGFAVSTEAYD